VVVAALLLFSNRFTLSILYYFSSGLHCSSNQFRGTLFISDDASSSDVTTAAVRRPMSPAHQFEKRMLQSTLDDSESKVQSIYSAQISTFQFK